MGTKCLEFTGSYTFDEAITKTGHGRFHYKVFSICALCILCVGFQNGLTSYVFSGARCDLNFRSQDLGLLNVSFMLGGTISAFLWGVIADMNGRKNILVWTILADAVTTVICSFMQTFTGLMICRFINGVLIGCGGSVTYTYLSEFYSPRLRAKSVCYSGIAFIAGWVLLPLLAYSIQGMNFQIDIVQMSYKPWRVFLIIIAVPEFLAGLCLLQLPESPKFLHDKNRSERALKILINIYLQNTNNKDNQDFLVKQLIDSSQPFQVNAKAIQCQGKSARLLQDLVVQIRSLFAPHIRIKTVVISLIMLSNMFGYFGLGLWLPEFFIRFEKHYRLHPNQSITIREISFSDDTNSTEHCPAVFDANTFQNTLIVSITALVANTLGGWLIGRITVKALALSSLLLGGFSSLSVYWLSSSLGILVVSSIFQAAMATGNMVIGSIVVEQFPTSIGAMAMCMAIAIGRVGAIASNTIFKVLLGEHNGEAIVVVSVVLFLGAALCLAVPSPNHRKVEETMVNSSNTINISVIHLEDRVDENKMV